MDSIIGDVRHGARALLRSRSFTIPAVLTLALGIAANSTVFSLVNQILLKPLPYPRSEELVSLTGSFARTGETQLSVLEVLDLRERSKDFSDIVMTAPISGNLTAVDVPERIFSMGVSAEFFRMVGVAPQLGRTFSSGDETPGITPIGIISYDLWQRRFGGRKDVIGRTLRLDEDEYAVVGVMPRSFRHPGASIANPVDFWYPAGFRATPFQEPKRGDHFNTVVARLKPGVSLERAQSELRTIALALNAEHPEDYEQGGGWTVNALPLQATIVGDVRQTFRLLLGAVALVLLIACVNVASLQLARGAARSGEIALRAAMGADSSRILRLLLAESLLVSLAGGAVGLTLTYAGVSIVRALAPADLSGVADVGIDARVLLFTLVVSAATSLVFGLAPGVIAARPHLAQLLRGGGRGGSADRSRTRARKALVAAEIALALVLLAGGGLLVRSFVQLKRTASGFQEDHILTMQMSVPYPNNPELGKYVKPDARAQYFQEVVRRVSEQPGVLRAGAVSDLPFTITNRPRQPTSIEGSAVKDPADLPTAEWRSATGGYFDALRIPLIRGRSLSDGDKFGAPLVAVINQALAKRLFGTADPVGRRIQMVNVRGPGPLVTIVGVVGDTRTQAPDREPLAQVYTSLLQRPSLTMSLVARTRGAPETLATDITRTVRSVENDQPVFAVASVEQITSNARAARRFALFNLLGFAILAVILAGVGIYGLIAFTVAQRTREIGVRMALGAGAHDIVKLVVSEGMRLASAGVVLGIGAALIATRLLAAQLFGVGARDPFTFAVTTGVLVAVALAASYLPARRAARVEAITAIRQE
jgi:predicted permease